MKRTYKTTDNPDGSVTVESTGPGSRLWRGIRFMAALPFLVAAPVSLFQGHFSTAAVALLVGAIIFPRTRGRR